MEENELKTSPKQRIVIATIAIIMLGTFIASYAAILAGSSSNSSSGTQKLSDEKLSAYEENYYTHLEKFKAATATDFTTFKPFLSEVVAYNESSANLNGLAYRDLLPGTGKTLAEGDTNYLAYYVGWCADETIFDSSLDSTTNPTAFKSIINAQNGLIEGWNSGVVGMRIGGVREVTIPGELAYGDQREICGGYNKPLKFLIMTMDSEDPKATIAEEFNLAYTKLQYAYYGIDYDEEMAPQE